MPPAPGFALSQWHSIADAAPALVRLCDGDVGALYFNRHWLEFTGVDSSRQLGHGWLALVHEADVEAPITIAVNLSPRQFVMNAPDDRDATSITQAIIAMARGLKLNTITEGVETTAQLRFLRAAGCDKMQGYLFSRPLAAEAFDALVRAHGRNRSRPPSLSRPRKPHQKCSARRS